MEKHLCSIAVKNLRIQQMGSYQMGFKHPFVSKTPSKTAKQIIKHLPCHLPTCSLCSAERRQQRNKEDPDSPHQAATLLSFSLLKDPERAPPPSQSRGSKESLLPHTSRSISPSSLPKPSHLPLISHHTAQLSPRAAPKAFGITS